MPGEFVTRNIEFYARAKSSRSGGQDMIAKPFLSFEITVKALSMVLRRRLDAAAATAASPALVNAGQMAGVPKESKVAGSTAVPPGAPQPKPASVTTASAAPVQVPAAAAANHGKTCESSPPAPQGSRAPTFFAQAPAHIEAIRHQLQALGYAGSEIGNTDIFRNVNLSMLWL